MVVLNASDRRPVTIALTLALLACATSCTSLNDVTAPSCAFTLSAGSASFGNQGGTGSFGLHAPNSCSWTVSANDSWISFTTPTSGSGDATIGFTIAANGDTATRSATVDVSGQSFTVSQAAASNPPPPPPPSCSFAVVPGSASFQGTGGSGTLAVTAVSSCAWTATSQVGWITITSGKSGTGTGAVKYTVAENNAKNSRTGNLVVAGRTVSIFETASKK
jgi:hypothetical protein